MTQPIQAWYSGPFAESPWITNSRVIQTCRISGPSPSEVDLQKGGFWYPQVFKSAVSASCVFLQNWSFILKGGDFFFPRMETCAAFVPSVLSWRPRRQVFHSILPWHFYYPFMTNLLRDQILPWHNSTAGK